MASKFESFLSAVGKEFKKGLDVALPIAKAVAAGLSIAYPGIGAVSELVINEIMNVEQKFAGFGQQSGTGAQKLATVIQIVEGSVVQAYKDAGITLDTSAVQNLINAFVAILNALPAMPAPKS